jgi:hypothetical protein
MNIIPINDELKTIPFLYIENDPILKDIDRDILEGRLGGFGEWSDLSEYNIKYHFNAAYRTDTFDEIVKADYILLNTSFIGMSSELLYNFVLGAIEKGLKDKIIINCSSFDMIGSLFLDMKDEIEKLDKEHNIKFYFPSRNMNAFVKYNNDEGFEI